MMTATPVSTTPVSTTPVSTRTVVGKKFCGLCKATGKSEQEYTSHFTKSVPGPKGVATCPLILSSICKCCSEQGHFADHCPKRADINRIEKKCKMINIEITKNKKKIVSQNNSASTNRFSILMEQEEEDTEPEPVVVVLATPAKKTFASVLASAPCAPMKKPQPQMSSVKSMVSPVKMAKLVAISDMMKQTRCSWADETTDSEGDDEEEDGGYY